MARYADSLLTEGEHVVLRAKQHWLSLIIRGRSALGLLIVGVLLFVVVFVLPGLFPSNSLQQQGGLSLGAILLIIAVVILFYRWWQWSNHDYVITNRRLLKVTGIFSKHSADSELEKINDAILDQPVLGRMFNYGDLTILTAAEEAVDTYHMLHDPVLFKKTMFTQKHQLESGYGNSAMPPTPPLRADVPMPPPPSGASAVASQQVAPQAPPPPMAASDGAQSWPPPPVAAPVAPAVLPSDPAPAAAAAAADVVAAQTTAADKSLDVTQTLARLADLRDSGAITAEDYEAKKQELLGRL